MYKHEHVINAGEFAWTCKGLSPFLFLQELIHREASGVQETRETYHELLCFALKFLLRACEILFHSECQ